MRKAGNYIPCFFCYGGSRTESNLLPKGNAFTARRRYQPVLSFAIQIWRSNGGIEPLALRLPMLSRQRVHPRHDMYSVFNGAQSWILTNTSALRRRRANADTIRAKIGAGAGIRTRDDALATQHFTPKLHTQDVSSSEILDTLTRFRRSHNGASLCLVSRKKRRQH